MVRLYRPRADSDAILSVCANGQTTSLPLTPADLRLLIGSADHFIDVRTDHQLREFGARGLVELEQVRLIES